jgi:hypothetical protein
MILATGIAAPFNFQIRLRLRFVPSEVIQSHSFQPVLWRTWSALRPEQHDEQTCAASDQQSPKLQAIAAKPVGAGAESQRWIPTGERSGLLTRIATLSTLSGHPLSRLRRIILKFNILRSNSASCFSWLFSMSIPQNDKQSAVTSPAWRLFVSRPNAHHSLKSPVWLCVSITLPGLS